MTRSRMLRPATWTLRARLLAALLALLAAVCIVIGFASVVAMDRFLLARLDDQLENASGRSRNAFDPPPGAPPDPRPGDRDGRGPGFLLAPGQNEGTLGAEVIAGQVTAAAVLDRRGEPTALPASKYDVLADVPVDEEPHTRDLGNELGDYRLVATEAPDGNVIVTGLPLAGVRDTVYQLAAAITVVAVLGLAAAAVFGAAIIRLTLRPLRRVAATAGRVAGMPLDRGEVALAVRVPDRDADARTEVGQVGAALNRMLEHVASALTARQHSEATVRQFVADASHELRTPLAAIRGYAEVTRPARNELPADVANALERVESHAVRMTGLVEDLLLLARLDSGRPVEHRQVDLSQLVVEAVNDAHVAGPDHRWELELPDEPVMVIGDAQHLHQVVANLLANARTHTPPGTRTTVALVAHSEAVLTVVDDGPGIPETVLPEIFDRFVRGDSSRSRAAGSTGLGLSIVAALVEAHGGSVEVDSRPGRTAFTVRFPLRDSAQERYTMPTADATLPA
jgi:two-component system, OmpR family, sensor kinase